MEKISIKVACSLVGKSEKTIRRGILSGKIKASLVNGIYEINKASLLDYYGLKEEVKETLKKEEINLEGSHTTQPIQPTSQELVLEAIKPLLDRISYYDTERERLTRLLGNGEQEKEEIKKRYELEKAILSKKITIWKWVAFGVVIVFGVSLLILNKILVINF